MNIMVNSYFSGAGLFDIGLLEGGLQIGKSFEIDLRCCKVQYQTLGDHVVQADISQSSHLTMRVTMQ
ncbi:hypothetical protein [Abyssogena phaseoliformis symbiont]|uniref:hypothetical protein n=1 Tax=Abyssogena phaseoliformis symbiont TaxID=596095 RepID=UPI003159CAB5